jgi:polysaccharide pyruvyl transferase WcaK-like protein
MLVRAKRHVSQARVSKAEDDSLKTGIRKGSRICFFGHFGTSNFGNESTFQAILHHLRRNLPDAQVACICSVPETLAITQSIEALPISSILVRQWNLRSPMARFLRKVFIGIPSELYRWYDAFRTLRGTAMLIIPGTGLVTDAFGLSGWGPYNLFKWTALAKLRRCKVLFVSVGVGPIYGTVGRYLVKSALSLADFRSYRDQSSMDYLKGIGFEAHNDRVYPDLAFSLPDDIVPLGAEGRGSRPVIGLGLMKYAGKYSVEEPSNAIYRAYLENLVVFVEWLLAHEYDIRLLIGDGSDRAVTQEFRSLLKARLGVYDEERITDPPLFSVEQFLSQLATTDLVVATRFHNVLLALLLNKPAISISFHPKCSALMNEMSLSEYSHDINHINADRLISQFCDLERNAEKVKALIKRNVQRSRKALDEQYNLIFNEVSGVPTNDFK